MWIPTLIHAGSLAFPIRSLVSAVPQTVWAIDTTSAAPPNGWGAQLKGNTVDFSQGAPPAGSFMNYVECNGNVQTTYDVRWNIQTISANGTYLVTVGARPKGGLPT